MITLEISFTYKDIIVAAILVVLFSIVSVYKTNTLFADCLKRHDKIMLIIIEILAIIMIIVPTYLLFTCKQ